MTNNWKYSLFDNLKRNKAVISYCNKITQIEFFEFKIKHTILISKIMYWAHMDKTYDEKLSRISKTHFNWPLMIKYQIKDNV